MFWGLPVNSESDLLYINANYLLKFISEYNRSGEVERDMSGSNWKYKISVKNANLLHKGWTPCFLRPSSWFSWLGVVPSLQVLAPVSVFSCVTKYMYRDNLSHYKEFICKIFSEVLVPCVSFCSSWARKHRAVIRVR